MISFRKNLVTSGGYSCLIRVELKLDGVVRSEITGEVSQGFLPITSYRRLMNDGGE